MRTMHGVVAALGLAVFAALSSGPALGWGGPFAGAGERPVEPPRPGEWAPSATASDFDADASSLGGGTRKLPGGFQMPGTDRTWWPNLALALARPGESGRILAALAPFDPSLESFSPISGSGPVPLAIVGLGAGNGVAARVELEFEFGGHGLYFEEGGPGTEIPEPHGIGLAVIGAATLLLRRRRARER